MGSSLPPLSELLTEHVLVADGAMGTQFYERGVFLNTCYDQLNLTRQELVLEVHRAYVQAGAELIQTNTYGANRVKLGGHGLEGQLVAVNRRGVELAREAAGNRVYVGGSVGPLGIRIEPLGPTSREEAWACFAVTQPVFDLAQLETFLARIHDLAIPIVVGLWPLLSLRNAEFMHHEVPGVLIPEGVMQRMADAPDAGSARAEGVAIVRELLERVRPLVQGVQISAPMGLYEQVIQVMS